MHKEYILTKKIIHTDNSDFFRKMVKTFLSEEGYVTESTDSGIVTIEAVEANSVEAIILGMALKDMSVEELIKKVIVFPQKIPIIILTSNDNDSEKEKYLQIGLTAYISKSGNWQSELLEALSTGNI